MTKIVQCLNCNRDINLEVSAYTECPECNGYFCLALISECFSHYHRDNDLKPPQHKSLSILDPTWKINLKSKKDASI